MQRAFVKRNSVRCSYSKAMRFVLPPTMMHRRRAPVVAMRHGSARARSADGFDRAPFRGKPTLAVAQWVRAHVRNVKSRVRLPPALSNPVGWRRGPRRGRSGGRETEATAVACGLRRAEAKRLPDTGKPALQPRGYRREQVAPPLKRGSAADPGPRRTNPDRPPIPGSRRHDAVFSLMRFAIFFS